MVDHLWICRCNRMSATSWAITRGPTSPMRRTATLKIVRLHDHLTSSRAHVLRPPRYSALRRCSRPPGRYPKGVYQFRKILDGSEHAAPARRTTSCAFHMADRECGQVSYERTCLLDLAWAFRRFFCAYLASITNLPLSCVLVGWERALRSLKIFQRKEPLMNQISAKQNNNNYNKNLLDTPPSSIILSTIVSLYTLSLSLGGGIQGRMAHLKFIICFEGKEEEGNTR